MGSRRLALLIGTSASVLAGVLAGATYLVLSVPERVDVTVGAPAQEQVMRTSTWTFRVRNMGPAIQRFSVRLGGGDAWLAQHEVLTTTHNCRAATAANLLVCGGLEPSDSETITLSATPKAGGDYSFSATFCDCADTSGANLLGPDSQRWGLPGTAPYTIRWRETVLPEPQVAISVADDNGNAVAGATVGFQGSSVSGTTASTGVAQIGLGPLAPGIYTVIASAPGYVNTGSNVTVPEFGGPPATLIRMPYAPPLGTFVWHWKSTEWYLIRVTGGNPNYSLTGVDIEWHCFGNDWSTTGVTVTLGRDTLSFGSLSVPMGPGAISSSWIANGQLPDINAPAPDGTCINGQNAW
jgi:hypothetical protein